MNTSADKLSSTALEASQDSVSVPRLDTSSWIAIAVFVAYIGMGMFA